MRSCFLLLAVLCQSLAADAANPPSLKAPAWELSHAGVQHKNAEQRAIPEALKLARAALEGEKARRFFTRAGCGCENSS
jgi:hypothetical protein